MRAVEYSYLISKHAIYIIVIRSLLMTTRNILETVVLCVITFARILSEAEIPDMPDVPEYTRRSRVLATLVLSGIREK